MKLRGRRNTFCFIAGATSQAIKNAEVIEALQKEIEVHKSVYDHQEILTEEGGFDFEVERYVDDGAGWPYFRTQSAVRQLQGIVDMFE